MFAIGKEGFPFDKNEYRCHNGMHSIPNILYHDGSLNPDCIDRTDEVNTVGYWDKCHQDPAFRCEEHSCHPGRNDATLPCGDGQCVKTFSKCKNSRGIYREVRPEFPIIRQKCWTSMACLTKMQGYDADGDKCPCFYYEDCGADAHEYCPSIFAFPAEFVALEHVFFVFVTNRIPADSNPILPTYICYDRYRCDLALPSVQVDIGDRKRMCLNLDETGIEFEYHPDWVTLVKLY